MGSAARAAPVPQGAAAPADATDAEIVERAKRGDREAFGVLVQRHQGRAYRLALRVLRDEERARDAVQDSFLKVYGSLDRFEGRSSFYTWLYRLVMNVCLDMKRRDRSDRHVEWSEEHGWETAEGSAPGSLGAAPPESAGPLEAVERSELRTAMARAIAELPDDARRTLELREVDGLSYAEIAASLGVPKGTVMSRLYYARKRLRGLLVESGAVEAAEE